MELNKKTSKRNYYAFLWHAVFLALAVNFMDVDTIIPAMMLDAGSSPLQLGILTAIMLGGGRVAQLFFVPFLNNRSSKKGYLLGGIACVLYAVLVGYFGGIKKAPGLLKMVKMKLNKNMSDDTAAKICIVMSIIVLAGGIFLFLSPYA